MFMVMNVDTQSVGICGVDACHFDDPLRGGAVAARWAHNPKVGGSNPPPATTFRPVQDVG